MSVSHAETLEANGLVATSPAGVPASRSVLGEATNSCCQGSAPHSQALLLSPGVEGAACRGWAGDKAEGIQSGSRDERYRNPPEEMAMAGDPAVNHLYSPAMER